METRFELWQRNHQESGGWGAYRPAYSGQVELDAQNPEEALERLFELFNVNHPHDFVGHSMSVGDRVVMAESTFECKPMGWESVEHPTLAPDTTDRYLW